MALTDKIAEIKKLINLICEAVPVLLQIIKEIIVVVKDLKTV